MAKFVRNAIIDKIYDAVAVDPYPPLRYIVA